MEKKPASRTGDLRKGKTPIGNKKVGWGAAGERVLQRAKVDKRSTGDGGEQERCNSKNRGG